MGPTETKFAMESILKAAYGFTKQESRLLIVHLDDAVETKLDPTGNQALERLLSAIDDRWADGQKICFVGTSTHSHELGASRRVGKNWKNDTLSWMCY